MAVAAPSAPTGRVALLCAGPGAFRSRAAAAWILVEPGGQPFARGYFKRRGFSSGAALSHLQGVGDGTVSPRLRATPLRDSTRPTPDPVAHAPKATLAQKLGLWMQRQGFLTKKPQPDARGPVPLRSKPHP